MDRSKQSKLKKLIVILISSVVALSPSLAFAEGEDSFELNERYLNRDTESGGNALGEYGIEVFTEEAFEEQARKDAAEESALESKTGKLFTKSADSRSDDVTGSLFLDGRVTYTDKEAEAALEREENARQTREILGRLILAGLFVLIVMTVSSIYIQLRRKRHANRNINRK